jgi:hypothetical protein
LPLFLTWMNIFFSMCTHPNEYQRRELSETMGLTTQQVKFWFQNKITQIKVWSKNFNLQNLNYTVCCHLPRHPSAITTLFYGTNCRTWMKKKRTIGWKWRMQCWVMKTRSLSKLRGLCFAPFALHRHRTNSLQICKGWKSKITGWS